MTNLVQMHPPNPESVKEIGFNFFTKWPGVYKTVFYCSTTACISSSKDLTTKSVRPRLFQLVPTPISRAPALIKLRTLPRPASGLRTWVTDGNLGDRNTGRGPMIYIDPYLHQCYLISCIILFYFHLSHIKPGPTLHHKNSKSVSTDESPIASVPTETNLPASDGTPQFRLKARSFSQCRGLGTKSLF